MATAQVEERQLLKAMTWWDGFVVALANPGFLLAGLGGSIGALGTTGAWVLWTISICLGALQNNIHAELASMFPNKSGGVALYAHEAWRKYLTFIGPLATFGYWIGWSVVLAVNGLVAGTLIQAEWFSGSTWTETVAGFDLTLPIVLGIGLILVVWLFNIYGVRPAVWFGYVTGALLCIPVVRAHVPALRHGRLVELEHAVGDRRQRRPRARADAGCTSCAGRRTGSRWWRPSRPSTRTPSATRTKALRAAAVFSRARLRAAAARPGRHARHRGGRRRRHDHRLLHAGLRRRSSATRSANVMIFCVVAGLVLSMNTATMDGSQSPVRHRPRRHDDPPVRHAEPLPRARRWR